MSIRDRRLLWAVSVIIAFVLGYLLGRKSANCPSQNGGSGSVMSNGGEKSPSSPSRLKVSGSGTGDVNTSGKSYANGADSGGIAGTGGGGGGEDELKGRTNGTGQANGSGELVSTPKGVPSLGSAVISGLGSGTDGFGIATKQGEFGPGDDTVTSPDSRYDLTGLPRYSAAVTRLVSGLSTRKDAPRDTSTIVALITSDSFDSVASWYESRVPSGWHESKIGNMEQMRSQLSEQNILKMLSAASGGAPSDNDSAAPNSAPAEGHAIATWTAPDNDAHHYRGIMVTSAPGVPTHVLMKRAVTQ